MGAYPRREKSRFCADLVAYAVINAFLIGVWMVAGFDHFWSGWVLAGVSCCRWTIGTSTAGGRSPRATSITNCARGAEYHRARAAAPSAGWRLT